LCIRRKPAARRIHRMRPARMSAAVVSLDSLPACQRHEDDVTTGAARGRGGVLLGGHAASFIGKV
jgi:hypothetical protein